MHVGTYGSHNPFARAHQSALACAFRPMADIYANNAGTTWPKAPGVIDAASAALAAAPEVSRQVLQAARTEVCNLLGIDVGRIGYRARHLGAQRVPVTLPQPGKPHAQIFDRCSESRRDLFLVRWNCRSTRHEWL